MVKVQIVGDVMIDQYIYGQSTKLSPEAPVPVISKQNVELRLGGAGNVARNVVSLECDAIVSGLAGFDDSFSELLELLAQHGINQDIVQLDGYDTIKKTRIVANHKQIARVDAEKLTQKVTDFNLHLDCDALVLSDYNKGALNNPAGLIAEAREKGVPIVVDPKGTKWEKYSGSTLLTPNLSEWHAYSGTTIDLHGKNPRVFEAIERLNLDAILVTLSENGMMLFHSNGETTHLTAESKDVVDVTGAGDTVVATLACMLAEGKSLLDACILANKAAGIVIQNFGTSFVERKDVFANQCGLTAKIVTDHADLVSRLEAHRNSGKEIGFTNGCFDILHAGHVQYLQQASDSADILVVAINSDESVQRLKGENRPVNTATDRALVLAGLGAVDFVTVFEEDTPTNLIEMTKPNILMKGGDYSSTRDIVGFEVVEAYGGRVKLLSGYAGLSTTLTLEKLNS